MPGCTMFRAFDRGSTAMIISLMFDTAKVRLIFGNTKKSGAKFAPDYGYDGDDKRRCYHFNPTYPLIRQAQTRVCVMR